MPQVQDRSLDLLASSLVRYHCTTMPLGFRCQTIQVYVVTHDVTLCVYTYIYKILVIEVFLEV